MESDALEISLTNTQVRVHCETQDTHRERERERRRAFMLWTSLVRIVSACKCSLRIRLCLATVACLSMALKVCLFVCLSIVLNEHLPCTTGISTPSLLSFGAVSLSPWLALHCRKLGARISPRIVCALPVRFSPCNRPSSPQQINTLTDLFASRPRILCVAAYTHSRVSLLGCCTRVCSWLSFCVGLVALTPTRSRW